MYGRKSVLSSSHSRPRGAGNAYSDQKRFSRTASVIPSINAVRMPSRGGIRL
ncbi:MAG: hypothetical protein [Arizlama microvirus]|nr:MAG: hypothetical protein [Arizlama microvirus]